MMYCALDLETHIIEPGRLVPPMVCLSVAFDPGEAEVVHRRDPACEQIVRKQIELALDGKRFLIGAYIAFDMAVIANEYGCLQEVFALYEEGRILDVGIRQKLIDIAAGCYRMHGPYNLATLAKRHEYPVELDKSADSWRLRYGELDNVPMNEWPREAREYSEHDSRAVLHIALRQDRYSLPDQHRQAQAEFALHLMSAHGLRTDPVMVERYRGQVAATLAGHERTLREAGLLRETKKGLVRNAKFAADVMEALWAEKGISDFPKTPTGRPQVDADAVAALGEPIMVAYQEYSSSKTAWAHVEELEKGIFKPIHTRFETLAETGRTTSSGPNVQNRPTEPGDRECFVPRKGQVFVDIDFDMLELRTLAQVCKKLFGYSKLGDVLNAGGDPHAEVACSILGISSEEGKRRKKDKSDLEFYNSRQGGKVVDFGVPGGLGRKTLRMQARKLYKLNMTEEETQQLIWTAKRTWPEWNQYFRWISDQCGPNDSATLTHLFSERVRGQVPYTVACNSLFQGLGADAAKRALWALTRACYIGPLAGCRPVNFIHDQVLVEVPEDYAMECAQAIKEIWCIGATEFLPDVPATAEPVLCCRWSKLAGDFSLWEEGPLKGQLKSAADGGPVWEWKVARESGAQGCLE